MIFRRKKDESDLSDEELMIKYRQGSSSAFDILYNRYSVRLYNYIVKMLNGDRHNSEDLLQDIFMKIIHNPELFDTDRIFSVWIFKVAYNRCREYIRKYKYLTLIDFYDEEFNYQSSSINAEKILDSKILIEQINQELDKMGEEHKSVFILKYTEDFSIKEIAQTMNIPEGTVKSRLFYTIRKLSAKLSYHKNERY